MTAKLLTLFFDNIEKIDFSYEFARERNTKYYNYLIVDWYV